MSELMLDVGQANELKLALRRHDFTSELVKQLSEGEILGEVRGVLCGTHRIVEIPLLTHVRTLTTTAAKPTIAWKSENFKKWFDSSVEDGERSAQLTLRKLERGSVDGPIIEELDGEEAAECSKADFFAALAEKERTRDFTWLIAYVKDNDSRLRAVRASWCVGGWDVGAYSVGNPLEWPGGSRVLSRN